ncbi:branched-chain amino acid ABC transporter permease [Clostridiaceae bacterium HSG29]|nr:branched-chain amino acid ABC transporter permease [Clostridiaceae bacterium HSG29]
MIKIQSKVIKTIILAIIVIIIVGIAPFKTSTITILSTVLIYGIAAMGYNVLLGYAGQISLGHAAFIGLGAYVSAYATDVMGIPFLFAVLLSGIIPIILGLILGGVALRLEGHYLAIATLGFGVTVQQLFKVLTKFTNGFAGRIAPSAYIFGNKIKGVGYLIMLIMITTFLAIIIENILKTKTGRAFIAMRDSEHAAKAMGIDIVKYKLIAFSISAFYAGIAGSLYMHLVKYTQPDVWGSVLSINILAMVVIGGLTSVGGSILGAAFIVLMPHLVAGIPYVNTIPSASIIITGIVIVIIIRFMPMGLITFVNRFKRRVTNVRG